MKYINLVVKTKELLESDTDENSYILVDDL